MIRVVVVESDILCTFSKVLNTLAEADEDLKFDLDSGWRRKRRVPDDMWDEKRRLDQGRNLLIACLGEDAIIAGVMDDDLDFNAKYFRTALVVDRENGSILLRAEVLLHKRSLVDGAVSAADSGGSSWSVKFTWLQEDDWSGDYRVMEDTDIFGALRECEILTNN